MTVGEVQNLLSKFPPDHPLFVAPGPRGSLSMGHVAKVYQTNRPHGTAAVWIVVIEQEPVSEVQGA